MDGGGRMTRRRGLGRLEWRLARVRGRALLILRLRPQIQMAPAASRLALPDPAKLCTLLHTQAHPSLVTSWKIRSFTTTTTTITTTFASGCLVLLSRQLPPASELLFSSCAGYTACGQSKRQQNTNPCTPSSNLVCFETTSPTLQKRQIVVLLQDPDCDVTSILTILSRVVLATLM